jgi:hypothetical protein
MTPAEIEQAYSLQRDRPFPYEDCRYLKKKCKIQVDAFIADLELYWADIASFASSATHLTRRSQLQILRGTEVLSKDFFERFPSYADLRKAITVKTTPSLWERMQLNEEERTALLALLKRELWMW